MKYQQQYEEAFPKLEILVTFKILTYNFMQMLDSTPEYKFDVCIYILINHISPSLLVKLML